MDCYVLIFDKILVAIATVIHQQWLLLRKSYLSIHQEPVDFPSDIIGEAIRKTICIFQQYNSKKVALAFFALYFLQTAYQSIARRILVDAAIVGVVTAVVIMLMPGLNWQAVILTTIGQYFLALLWLKKYFYRVA